MLNNKIKKITLNILFFLSFLILMQNYSFAQNIFDELKKATDQIQKDLEKSDTKQKPAPTTTPAPKTPVATPAPAPKAPVAAPAPKAPTTSVELANFKSSFPKCEGSDPKTFNKCYAEISYTQGLYIGEFKSGMLNGKGIFKFNDGRKFEGEYKEGKRNGKGIFIGANGDKFQGEYKDDNRNGKGILNYANGDKFEGEYKEGMRNGKGTYTSRDGSSVFKGEYKNDMRNGQGFQKSSDGSTYDGPYKDNERHGKGVVKNPAGLKMTVIYEEGEVTQMLK
jgi:hypothetical protein